LGFHLKTILPRAVYRSDSSPWFVVVVARLREHVVEREEGSLLKRELFESYLKFCMQSNLNPTNDATFGRMVNAVFPNVQQRRLRRDSHIKKWHYCGIAYCSDGTRSPPTSAATHTASPFTTTSTTPTSDASLSTLSSAYHPAQPLSSYHHHPPPAYRHGYPPPPPPYHSALRPPPPLYTPFYPEQAYQTPTHAYDAPLPAYAPHHHPASSYESRLHSRLAMSASLDEPTTVSPYLHPSAPLPAASEPYEGLPPAPAFSRVEGQLARVYSADQSVPGKGKTLTDRHEIGNGRTVSTSGSPPSVWLRNDDNSLPFPNQLQFYASAYRREIWGVEYALLPACGKD
jgi:hypothetical protein